MAASPFAQPYPDAPSLELFAQTHANGQSHTGPAHKVMIVLRGGGHGGQPLVQECDRRASGQGCGRRRAVAAGS